MRWPDRSLVGAQQPTLEQRGDPVHARQQFHRGFLSLAFEPGNDVRIPQLLKALIWSPAVRGSTLHTDGWAPYQGLEKLGYSHVVTRLKGQGKEAAVELLPRVHRVASLLKRWLLGTHQGAVGPTHLDYYLDEFTFRFNRRRSASRGKLFFRLLEQAVQVGPVTYETIVGKK